MGIQCLPVHVDAGDECGKWRERKKGKMKDRKMCRREWRREARQVKETEKTTRQERGSELAVQEGREERERGRKREGGC